MYNGTKILLKDITDGYYTDLIVFKDNIDKKDIIKVKADILEKSNEGKNKIPFSVYGHYDLKEQLMQKLKEEGFKLLHGYQLNVGRHSQATLYVVW